MFLASGYFCRLKSPTDATREILSRNGLLFLPSLASTSLISQVYYLCPDQDVLEKSRNHRLEQHPLGEDAPVWW
jgi:hypothetical protein